MDVGCRLDLDYRVNRLGSKQTRRDISRTVEYRGQVSIEC